MLTLLFHPPPPIPQAESYRAVLNPKFRHVALADQAGSGKTLAYLLPLLQELKEEEKALGRPATVPGSPRILIVTPTGGESSNSPYNGAAGVRFHVHSRV